MPNRPSIPAEMARKVLTEAGHRCAVCGTSSPLEKAHIIPWHKSKEHKAEDLICLCANCHERADFEKWGEKTLREYKLHPWVMRQYGKTVPHEKNKRQSDTSASLQEVTDRKEIIRNLTMLRIEGVKTRNRGESILHESGIAPWWDEHLDWRKKAVDTIAVLDPSLAYRWSTLDTFIPKRTFPKALSPEHRHKLQMFDAWLDRLIDVIYQLDQSTYE